MKLIKPSPEKDDKTAHVHVWRGRVSGDLHDDDFDQHHPRDPQLNHSDLMVQRRPFND